MATFNKHIEDFAWQNNCDLLELVARPMKRVLKPLVLKKVMYY